LNFEFFGIGGSRAGVFGVAVDEESKKTYTVLA